MPAITKEGLIRIFDIASNKCTADFEHDEDQQICISGANKMYDAGRIMIQIRDLEETKKKNLGTPREKQINAKIHELRNLLEEKEFK